MPVLFTQAEVDLFIDAMLKNPGVLEMDIGDRHYRFDTLEKMREHLAYMERNLDTNIAVNPARTRYGATSKGV